MRNRLQGVTLLETLVYLGLFSIIIILILSFMLSTQESTQRTQRKGNLHQASELVIQHLNYSMTRSKGIVEGESVFENNSGRLEVQFESTSKRYIVIDSRIYYDGIAITPPNVIVSKFWLEAVYNNHGEIVGVRTDIVLTSPRDSNITEPINMLFTFR
jgi:type II secretory pathway pseudopilin PulG